MHAVHAVFRKRLKQDAACNAGEFGRVREGTVLLTSARNIVDEFGVLRSQAQNSVFLLVPVLVSRGASIFCAHAGTPSKSSNSGLPGPKGSNFM